jgi:hypothetical protein
VSCLIEIKTLEIKTLAVKAAHAFADACGASGPASPAV